MPVGARDNISNLYGATRAALFLPIFVSTRIRYHVHTLLLFTWTDYKTIFIPITAFACSVGPLHSPQSLFRGWAWIFLHQLLCNVSNQARSKNEDIINRPWRPLPSGRITEPHAVILRWALVSVCLGFSAVFGPDLVLVTIGLFVTTFLYDEGGLASHVIGKNLCNVGGYVTFEIGATKLIGISAGELDLISWEAVILSGILIFTTIQAQDFRDVEGDAAAGRITFPIYAPEGSRIFTFAAIVSWSIFLTWFWEIGIMSSAAFIALGAYSGLRYYLWRTVEIDKRSYLIYSFWLVFAHTLPLNVRCGLFAI